MIINFDPTQPDALTISEFCKTQKISRSIFYRIRSRFADHPLPNQSAKQYNLVASHTGSCVVGGVYTGWL